MEKEFEILRKTRKYLLEQIKDLSIEQLNEIPTGFSNNIIWHVGHLLATQQGMCYGRANIPLIIDTKYFEAYKPGTKPEKFIGQEEVENIKQQFITVIDQLEIDYNNNLFKGYPSFTNRYTFEHKNIEDTITFILYHEGLHLGYISAYKKLIHK